MNKIYRNISALHLTLLFIVILYFLFVYFPWFAVGLLVLVCFGFSPDYDLLELFSTESLWKKNLNEKERLLALEEARNDPSIKLLPIEHLGKEVTFLGGLGPKPFIEIEGERFFAVSNTGFIDTGTIVVIEDMRLDKYVVRASDVREE